MKQIVWPWIFLGKFTQFLHKRCINLDKIQYAEHVPIAEYLLIRLLLQLVIDHISQVCAWPRNLKIKFNKIKATKVQKAWHQEPKILYSNYWHNSGNKKMVDIRDVFIHSESLLLKVNSLFDYFKIDSFAAK